MGSLIHILDYDQFKMAKKVVTQKKEVDGFEAPRNSLELPVETSHSLHSGGDSIMYAYNGTYNWTEQTHCSTEAPIKKLISEEISERQNTKYNAPSVIARLMGVDMLPSQTKPVTQPVDKKKEMLALNLSNENFARNCSNGHVSYNSKYSKHKRFISYDSIEVCDHDRWNDGTTWNKPRSREHPQEEELQKFKKEFEAWQVARMKECSKFIELGSTPSRWLAQENLNEEKMVRYASSMGMMENAKPKEVDMATLKAHERGSFQKKEKKSFASEQDSSYARKRTTSVDFKLPSLVDYGKGFDPASVPSKIVILRPGPDAVTSCEESWSSSPCISEEKGSIEDFLEEVKERLKCELQGKTCKRSSSVRGGGIETPYSERPSDPKQIAQRIAKQVRESVTRDLGMNLFRSESTRSYRSEIQFNGTGSPEFISRDTRKFLAERLRNVLKEESRRSDPVITRGSIRSSALNTERHRTEKSRQSLNAGNKSRSWDIVQDESVMQSRSFRREPNDNTEIHEELSPRNLVRSLSAPVSGTSFGKLLLEDRHMLTGAHIRRKQEAIESITVNVKKRKKEKFNFREKVASLKYSFTFKGRLFGRKVQSSEQQGDDRQEYGRDILSMPTTTMNCNDDRHENSTEVPPSPASICSSVHEELWRPVECLSPNSVSDVASTEDCMMPNVFKEISTNLKELRRQLDELEIDGSEAATNGDQPTETDATDIEDQAEAYIRDLLLISGLCDGSCDKSLAKWDSLGKHINNQVFEEVEESHRQKFKNDEGYMKDQNETSNHKILFDLLNEVLPNVLGQPVSRSKFLRRAVDPVARPLLGRNLLDQVWQVIRDYIYPPKDKSCYSLDTMMARDLRSLPWSGWIEDDVNALGNDVECRVFCDLIDEMLLDIQS